MLRIAFLGMVVAVALSKAAFCEESRAVIRTAALCAVDVFAPGTKLYTNRDYVVAECPEALRGLPLLRSSIDWVEVECLEPGSLIVLTPDPVHEIAKKCSRFRELEEAGFVRIDDGKVFQLFGEQPYDMVRTYRGTLAKGDRLKLRKWAVIVGFSEAKTWAETEPRTPWTENTGELLYNGIRLPERWPPRTVRPDDTAPMPVPYLDTPPKVIPIDVGRQLFVDDFLVEESTLTRSFHLARKYEGNPILKPETSLETHRPRNSIACPKDGGVWWDHDEQVWKMWYEAGWIHTICYATSKDGLHWDRPELDIEPGTNRVLPPQYQCDSWNVVPDYDGGNPEQRYKIFVMPGGQGPAMSFVSADGVHWGDPVMTGETGDRSSMFYNPFRKKWVYSLRSSWRGRSRDYWEHDDFLKGAEWEGGQPYLWCGADELDPPDPEIGQTPQLYNLDAVAYESIMLGIFEIHLGPPNQECNEAGLPKITELNLAYSRDGWHWHRPDRRAFIRAERRDVWDRGYVQPVGGICTIHGDTLWFYYSGFQGDPERKSRHFLETGMYDRGSTGVAFLRRDGFASMDGGAAGGELLTRPVSFSGKHLFVNANTAKGALRAEICDESGAPIAPFTLDNCQPLSSDSTLAQIGWNGGDDLSSLAGKPVRIRFRVKDGSLYAFWVSRDQTGRSDGYVAAGGPGYTSLVDTVGHSALAQVTPLKVFVLAGQSNMVGSRAVAAELPEALQGIQEQAFFFDGQAWVALAPGVTEETGFGPELSFACQMTATLKEPVGIIKHSVGGTDLAERWDPVNPKSLYAELVEKVRAARESRPVEVVGMLWMQGERDSKDAEMAAAYGDNLGELIKSARRHFENPDMPFVAGRVNPPEAEFLHVGLVRNAQEECRLGQYAFIDCDTLPKGPDNLHYDTEGVVTMGERFAEAMLKLLGR
jgi:Carbohydrate esterase, sialic acid-specific acetylesterase